MKQFYRLSLYCFAIVFLLLASCDGVDDWQQTLSNVPIVNLNDPYRAFETFGYSLTQATIKDQLQTHELSALDPRIKYDVSVHRFTYQTKYKDSVVTASGVIAIPIGMSNPPLLVFHHGTLFDDASTPSLFPEVSWGNDLIASCGYITLTPDYIGYGTTKDIIHPYHIYQPLVNTSVDMIQSARKFLIENHITFDDHVFLAGFSEGGYAAFAVQKEIETHPEYNIHVKASAPGAGAYDLGYQFKVTTDADIYPGPGYMLLVIAAYNDYYWHLPVSNFLNPTYETKITTLLNGNYTEDQVHHALPKSLKILFQSSFLDDFRNNPQSPFTASIASNNVNNFRVKSPTRFIHGAQDDVVPFVVAQKSYNDLIALGVSPETLTLYSFQGNHDFKTYLRLMVEWFSTFE